MLDILLIPFKILLIPFELLDLLLGGSGDLTKHVDKILDKAQDNDWI